MKQDAAQELRQLVGEVSLDSYVDRVRAALGALPQEIRFISQKQSKPAIFESINDATTFLKKTTFDFSAATENCIYEITYSNGTEFERTVASVDELRKLHQQIERLAQHVSSLQKQKA